MKSGTQLVRRAVGSVLTVLEQKKFVSQTVRKLLFGYENPLIKLGQDTFPKEKRWPHKLFGLFVGVSRHLCLGTLIHLNVCVSYF